MALVHYIAEVKSGLLLELPAEAQELHLNPGDKIAVQLDHESKPTITRRPNEKALAAMNEIARRQEGRPYSDGSNTQRFLIEARSGAMYDYDPTE